LLTPRDVAEGVIILPGSDAHEPSVDQPASTCRVHLPASFFPIGFQRPHCDGSGRGLHRGKIIALVGVSYGVENGSILGLADEERVEAAWTIGPPISRTCPPERHMPHAGLFDNLTVAPLRAERHRGRLTQSKHYKEQILVGPGEGTWSLGCGSRDHAG